jgi:hypothetical protein
VTFTVMGDIKSHILKIHEIQSDIHEMKKKLVEILLQTEGEFGAESGEAKAIRTLIWG